VQSRVRHDRAMQEPEPPVLSAAVRSGNDLDDPSIAPASQVEQRKPPRQRHRHSERRLLARCHNCLCRSGGSPDTSDDIQSTRRPGSCHSHASQAERGASERKAWILDPSSHLSAEALGSSDRARARSRLLRKPEKNCIGCLGRAPDMRRLACAALSVHGHPDLLLPPLQPVGSDE
jgi:hypothetical protein